MLFSYIHSVLLELLGCIEAAISFPGLTKKLLNSSAIICGSVIASSLFNVSVDGCTLLRRLILVDSSTTSQIFLALPLFSFNK